MVEVVAGRAVEAEGLQRAFDLVGVVAGADVIRLRAGR